MCEFMCEYMCDERRKDMLMHNCRTEGVWGVKKREKSSPVDSNLTTLYIRVEFKRGVYFSWTCNPDI